MSKGKNEEQWKYPCRFLHVSRRDQKLSKRKCVDDRKFQGRMCTLYEQQWEREGKQKKSLG